MRWMRCSSLGGGIRMSLPLLLLLGSGCGAIAAASASDAPADSSHDAPQSAAVSQRWATADIAVLDPVILISSDPVERATVLNCNVPVDGQSADLYFTASNAADQIDHLVSVETDAADMAMAHMHGVTFFIPPHGSSALEPGSNHVMLMDLTRPLHAGDSVWVTLHFKIAGELRARALVRSVASAAPLGS
jgi:copper(I)-binding protein